MLVAWSLAEEDRSLLGKEGKELQKATSAAKVVTTQQGASIRLYTVLSLMLSRFLK